MESNLVSFSLAVLSHKIGFSVLSYLCGGNLERSPVESRQPVENTLRVELLFIARQFNILEVQRVRRL